MPTSTANAAWFARRLQANGLAALSQEDLIALEGQLVRATLPPGKVLYSPSKPPTRICIIRSGRIELVAGAGRHRSIVQIAKSGDVIGDVYGLLRIPPLVTARTVESTVCLFLDVEALRGLLRTHPRVANLWVASLSARLAELHARMLEILGGTLDQRLARLLLQEAEDGVVRLPQASIAAMLNLQRSSVNRALRELERDGIVELGYRQVVISDRRRLTEIGYRGSYANLPPLL